MSFSVGDVVTVSVKGTSYLSSWEDAELEIVQLDPLKVKILKLYGDHQEPYCVGETIPWKKEAIKCFSLKETYYSPFDGRIK